MSAVPIGPVPPRTREEIVADMDRLIVELDNVEDDSAEGWVLMDWVVVPLWDRITDGEATGYICRRPGTAGWRLRGMLHDALMWASSPTSDLD